MARVWSLKSFLVLGLLLFSFFCFSKNAVAEEELDTTYTGSSWFTGDFVSNGRYQRIHPVHDNISSVMLYGSKSCGGAGSMSVQVRNSSNEVIGTTTATSVDTGGFAEYTFSFSTPLEITANTDYYLTTTDCFSGQLYSTDASYVYECCWSEPWANKTGYVKVYYQSGPPACESFTYTEWSQCDGYNQVRNWETKTPSDCEGGVEPDLSQPCSLDGNLRAIYPDQTSYYLYTGTTSKVTYGYYTNRISDGDYVNVYRLSGTSTETFISSSTIIDFDYPDKQMGFSFFTLTGTSSDYVKNQFTYYKVVPVLSGSDWQSEIFPIYWSSDENYFLSQVSGLDTSRGTDTPFLFGENLRSYICSADEWASGNWWTNLRCRTFYNLFSIFGKATNGLRNWIDIQKLRLKSLFPFSIPISIYESWIDSYDQGYPSDIAFLDVADVDGNIGFAVPEEWVGTSTTVLPMWGPQVFTDNDDLYNFFAFIRSFSTYSLWIAFFFGIWTLGHDIIFNEFGYHETMTARRKEDYQL